METSRNSQPITLFPEVAEGKVEKTISATHSGRVKFQGSFWPAEFYHAECHETAFPDDVVMVVGRCGITLLVIPKGYPLPLDGLKNLLTQTPQKGVASSEWTQRLSLGLSSLFRSKREPGKEPYFYQA